MYLSLGVNDCTVSETFHGIWGMSHSGRFCPYTSVPRRGDAPTLNGRFTQTRVYGRDLYKEPLNEKQRPGLEAQRLILNVYKAEKQRALFQVGPTFLFLAASR